MTLDEAVARWRKPVARLRPCGERSREAVGGFLYGDVDLPPGLAWPTHAGVDMVLLADLDLAALAATVAAAPWPADGRLLVFCSVDADGEIQEGHEHGLPAAVQVLYVPACRRRETAARHALPAVPIRYVPDRHDLPDPDAAIVRCSGWDEDAVARYRAYADAQRAGVSDAGDRFGGYPTPLQGNYLEYLAAEHAGLDDNATAHSAALAAARWRLLLQLESDHYQWGTDSGVLFFLIHDDHLAARDFSRVVALTQGY